MLAVGSIVIYRFTLLTLAGILALGCTPNPHEKIELTDNGNLLFYNTPATASYKKKLYASYMNNRGEIIVSTLEEGKIVRETVIHSYQERINWNKGKADDHASPSLILDRNRDRLIIATSYHGTPMHIYEYSIGKQKYSKIKEVAGRYTYPRLLDHQGSIYLLSRLQPKGILAGDLVLRKASDNFNKEITVIPSRDGEVVYAGPPAVTKDGFMVTYSMHNYEENRLIGFNLAHYSLEKNTVTETCNLSYITGKKSHSNRPTGLGYDGKTIMVATAYTNWENTHPKVKFDNFQRENNVIVAKGKKCDSFKIIEKRAVRMPYYHTSIAVNNNLEFLYFDKNKYHSNLKVNACFGEKKMMYPQFTRQGVIYSSMTSPYSIRDFENSLFLCNF